MPFTYANNVLTTLNAAVTSTTQTTITLSSTANLPTITAGQIFVITLTDAATNSVFEIMYGTARTGAVITVLRGQEGTAATTWLANDIVYSTDTAGILNNFLQPLNAAGVFGTNGAAAAGGGAPAYVQTAGDFTIARGASTGVLLFGNGAASGTGFISWATGTMIFGALANASTLNMNLNSNGSLSIAPTINATNTAGYVMPLYTAAGAQTTATAHAIQGQVTAAGASTTVTLGGSGAFTAGTSYTVFVQDLTAGTFGAIASVGATSFTFTSINAHLYSYLAIGV